MVDCQVPTLLLLDVCFAGRVATLPWDQVAARERQLWVLTGSESWQQAYGGRFTAAAATVLGRLTVGGLDDIDASVEVVPFATVGRRIGLALFDLCERDELPAPEASGTRHTFVELPPKLSLH